jgi:single-strand DNA-binding protein
VNIFNGTGNCGKDAEVRILPSGATVLNVSVGVKSGYGDREQTIWLNVSLFGKKAEGRLVEFLKKGQAVAFSGELSMREYKANDGTMKNSLELNANVLELIGKKSDNAPQAAAPQSQHNAAKANAYNPNDVPYNDDIGF